MIYSHRQIILFFFYYFFFFMNDTYLHLDLVSIMDRLWFGQIILFPDHPGWEQSSGYGFDDLDPNEESSSHPVITTCDESDEASNQSCLSMEESYKNEEEDKPWLTRGFTGCNNSDDQVAHTNSLSPSVAKDKGRRLRKWFSYSDPKSLRKSLSRRSLEDLEIEEVKGFMDLGFVFEKEHLSCRMMSVIPGLQRLGLEASDDVGDVDEKGISVIEGDKIRPYLSEAWLVRGADSPLLKLRIPDKVYASADMKKHLKYWARTVASVIKLES